MHFRALSAKIIKFDQGKSNAGQIFSPRPGYFQGILGRNDGA